MNLDEAFLKTAREALDSEIHVSGVSKPFRFFTATDCRNYAQTAGAEMGQLAAQIDETELHTVGELLAREAALASIACPRCAFEHAITEIVYAGEHIQQHYGSRTEQLNDSEQHLLRLAREWLADDTITRCLEGRE